MSREGAAVRLVRTAAPLYRDVATALERAIRDGVWLPGERIPTEAELESQFGASRGTLRIAIGELVRAGHLRRHPGRGTFVTGPEYRSFDRFFRYERRGGEGPIIPATTVLERTTAPADARTAAVLRIEPGSTVGYSRRLRFHRGDPFLLNDCFFQPDIWQRIERADLAGPSLYDQMKDLFGITVTHVDEVLRADQATPEESELLAVPAGSPVLRVERTAFTFGDRPIEFRRAVGRGDHFQYRARLR